MTPAPTCPRAGRWWNGCRWKARYEDVPSGYKPNDFRDEIFNGNITLWALIYRRVYVRDICVTCGATRERNET